MASRRTVMAGLAISILALVEAFFVQNIIGISSEKRQETYVQELEEKQQITGQLQAEVSEDLLIVQLIARAGETICIDNIVKADLVEIYDDGEVCIRGDGDLREVAN